MIEIESRRFRGEKEDILDMRKREGTLVVRKR